jgi:hypothetical protein
MLKEHAVDIVLTDSACPASTVWTSPAKAASMTTRPTTIMLNLRIYRSVAVEAMKIGATTT